MGVDVMADIEWFRANHGSDAPIILTLHHGTTHEFAEFSPERVNAENMFGRQFYFTSSEDDAERNYASLDGPDLKNRIAHAAELAWNAEEHDTLEGAIEEYSRMFFGGREAVLTVELTLTSPIILGSHRPHGLVPDLDEAYELAAARVAEEHGIDQDEARGDEHEELLMGAFDEIMDEAYTALTGMISTALDRLNMTRARPDADDLLLGLLRDEPSVDRVLEAVEKREPYIYLFENEDYSPHCTPVLAELLHLKGHDAIIRPNAEAACRNIEMEPGTVHVALSVDHADRIRILDRRELGAGMDFGM